MHVLIVGGDKIFSIENYYFKHLTEFGIRVSRFLAPNLFYEYYEKSIINKFFFKSGLSNVYNSINKDFKHAVESLNPDIIWIFKGMELYAETLVWVKSKNIKIVNYNPDNPFLFSGKGSGNSNITRSIGLYDLHFTYNLAIEKRIKSDFKTVKTSYLPFGFELDNEVVNQCAILPEIGDLCFLGNPDLNRSEFVKNLSKAGVKISVYGHDWSKYLTSNRYLSINEAVYGIDQWKVLRKYRIQLNLLRPHNLNSHNMRTFEIPGVGGIMLAPKTIEHEMFFENATQVFLYSSVNECVSLVKQILSLPLPEALNIRTSARERSIKSGYTYKDRASQVLQQFEVL
jgi:spore maturation protein CgeB